MAIDDIEVEARRPRKRIAKGPPRPRYLVAEDIDRVVVMMTTILSEHLTLRDRVDTHEHLLDRDGMLTRASLETFRPSAELSQSREAQHLAILRRVFRVLGDEFEDYDTPIPQ
jgi:hypothetical protein